MNRIMARPKNHTKNQLIFESDRSGYSSEIVISSAERENEWLGKLHVLHSFRAIRLYKSDDSVNMRVLYLSDSTDTQTSVQDWKCQKAGNNFSLILDLSYQLIHLTVIQNFVLLQNEILA